METLQSFLPWKKERHPSWNKMCRSWNETVNFIKFGNNILDYKEWNPWENLCKSWEDFLSSKERLPKSERQNSAFFDELYTIGKLTRDKLEEAKVDLQRKTDENATLSNQNSIWSQRCEKLQYQLDVEKQRMAENDRLHRNNLERLKLQKERELQQVKAKSEELEEELQQVKAKSEELEEELSSLESQDTLRDVVDRLGQVGSWNVFDWLCSCEEEFKTWNWNLKDFEKILLRCMDPSSFASLPTMVKKTLEMEWIDRYRFIAQTFIPDLKNLLYREKMREDDTVLQYFHRMWMIYRVAKYPVHVSKEDVPYKHAICRGLLPHLYQVGEQLRDEDYEDIESAVRDEEYSLSESEKKRMMERKAGPGFPSRMKIWKMLMSCPVDFEEIDEASYSHLLTTLSRHRDLETGAKITRIEYETATVTQPY
ncbi:uncharacterized protein LOC130267672 [Hyla sarda]|uniref:uncharacterized protein LOC130267672 n=1 Tax=Hyla sarda TaxID=327740 RepID=UPI0024C3E0AB|nr:uncharacterized protein LOC130267672 [Hyla sarda]XP_056373725.1 uncharacterized protein LOC130267672 [Hyla sarda]XP_056373726.1 uncharacterized protein LOC130267672 [Hyla sarda]